MNAYDVLDIPQDATDEEITSNFRQLALVHHPDKGGDTADMATLIRARDVLLDPEQRACLDRALTRPAHGVRRPNGRIVLRRRTPAEQDDDAWVPGLDMAMAAK